MRRWVAPLPEVEQPPDWVTHLEVGLRHIGSVDEAGNVSLAGVDRLYAAQAKWYREHGQDPGAA